MNFFDYFNLAWSVYGSVTNIRTMIITNTLTTEGVMVLITPVLATLSTLLHKAVIPQQLVTDCVEAVVGIVNAFYHGHPPTSA